MAFRILDFENNANLTCIHIGEVLENVRKFASTFQYPFILFNVGDYKEVTKTALSAIQNWCVRTKIYEMRPLQNHPQSRAFLQTDSARRSFMIDRKPTLLLYKGDEFCVETM